MADDTNGKGDVFVTDTTTKTTTRVSLGPGGRQDANGAGFSSISANGRYVAFGASSSLLTGRPDDHTGQIFVRDRVANTTTLMTRTIGGRPSEESSQSPSISADGRYVAYASLAADLGPTDENHDTDVYVTDRATGRTARVSKAAGGGDSNGASYNPVMSADGRFVAYESTATDLAPTRYGDHSHQVLRTDLATGRTLCLTCESDQSYYSAHPSISADGQRVAFAYPDGYVAGERHYSGPGVYLTDFSSGRTRRVAGLSSVEERSASLSPDGTYIVYSTDVRDPESRELGLEIVRTELSSGRSTVVSTYYGNRLQLGNGASFSPVAGNGARAVAFSSYADSLTPGDTNRTADVFWRQVGPYRYAPRPRLGG